MSLRTVVALVLLFSLLAPAPAARSGTLGYAKRIGGTDFERGYATAVDGAGNVYVVSVFEGTVDFDPNGGTTELTSSSADVAVVKLDPDGDLVWARNMGGPSTPAAVAIDGSGNVVVFGTFSASMDADPGPDETILTSAGNSDVFVVKLNASGDFVWAASFGGSATDEAGGVAVDGSGNVYLAGSFNGTVDFDPSTDTANQTSHGLSDAFLVKLNAGGDLVWAEHFGGSSMDFGAAVALDGNGSLYLVGHFRGAGDFNPGSDTTTLTSLANEDPFVVKLDAGGALIWARSFGGAITSDRAEAVAVDGSGNVVVAGSFLGQLDVDPGAGTTFLHGRGLNDAFVAKLDAAGNLMWARGFGSYISDEYGESVAVDGSGNVYLTGQFGSTAELFPGPGTASLTSHGNVDMFAMKLDAAGNLVWARGIGGSSEDVARGTAVDGIGSVYLTGYFSGTSDFDPGPATAELTSAGQSDLFLLKLVQAAPPVHTVPASQVTGKGAPLTFSAAGGNPVSIADADAGSSPLRVTLSAATGTLTLSTTAGLTFSQGDGTADPTMIFSGTLAAINAALDGLVFTPPPQTHGPAPLQITTFDQVGPTGGQEDTDTVAITITNQAPVLATNAGLVVAEGATATLGSDRLRATDIDNPPASLTYSVGTAPIRGSLKKGASVLGAGSTFTQAEIDASALTYSHDGGEATTDSFTFTLVDGDGGTIPTTTFPVTITPVNDPPVSVNDAYTGGAMQPLMVPASDGVLKNDSDPDSPSLQAQLVAGAAHGTVTLSPNGGFTYVPVASFAGTDTFTYRASDGTATSSPSTVTITVEPSHCAPRATVKVTTAVVGGKLQATVEALPLNSRTNNRLKEIRFKAFDNGTVTVNGQPVAAGATYSPPVSATQVVFQVARVTAGRSTTTIMFDAVDECGTWPSFVGGGPDSGF